MFTAHDPTWSAEQLAANLATPIPAKRLKILPEWPHPKDSKWLQCFDEETKREIMESADKDLEQMSKNSSLYIFC